MSRFEFFFLVVTFVGAYAGGITGALTGRRRETRREIDAHKRACHLAALSQPADDGGPVLTPAPH